MSQIIGRVCREMSSGRSPLLTHLVGFGMSERLTLILNDGKFAKLVSVGVNADHHVPELMNGYEYTHKIWADKKWTLYYYLWYTKVRTHLGIQHLLSICIGDFVPCFGLR